MGSHGHRIQLILFLAAAVVPCAVLIVLAVRIVNQDRELLTKRQADEQQGMVAQAQQKLSAVLKSIREDEIRTDLDPGQLYRHPETVFVGWTEDGGLVLPWEPERDRAALRCREWISQPGFSTAVTACGPPEVRSQEPRSAVACYQHAAAAAKHPAQAAYAKWLWARALENAGRSSQAALLFRSLLAESSAVTDEDGVPLKLHAAQSLLQTGAGWRQVVGGVESVLADRPWLAPMSSFAASEVAARLARGSKDPEETRAAEELRRKVAARVHVLEQAELLQTEFPRLRPLLKSRPQPAWAPFGDDIWLIGATGDPDAKAVVLAVRAEDAFRRLRVPGALRLADSREPEGQALGAAFPGLKVVMTAAGPLVPGAIGSLQRQAVYLALFLVVAATLFAAYLLWRDLKREMRLSEIRAQFVSSVSHELKTPLTAIRMFAETLQMGRCSDDETRNEYLGTIVNECQRLSRLVDGVLLFSKMEQGKKVYRFRSTQAADAVYAAARAMEYPLAQQGFHLHLAIDEGLPPLQADRDALEQAVLNLLSNAMKFSGDARDIELELCRREDAIVIRVTDHGIGIAPDEHSRIFEKFYRVPTAENQLIPGTGLGLALVAQIVRAHGGQVEVASAPGKGSTFCLRLPVAAGGPGGQGSTA